MRGLESELLVERAGELVVAAGNRLAHPKPMFCSQRKAPARLVELVESEGLLGHVQGAARGAFQSCVSGALKQSEVGAVEAALAVADLSGIRPVRPAGIEPAACGLKDRCSLAPRREPLTTELRARAAHDATTSPATRRARRLAAAE